MSISQLNTRASFHSSPLISHVLRWVWRIHPTPPQSISNWTGTFSTENHLKLDWSCSARRFSWPQIREATHDWLLPFFIKLFRGNMVYIFNYSNQLFFCFFPKRILFIRLALHILCLRWRAISYYFYSSAVHCSKGSWNARQTSPALPKRFVLQRYKLVHVGKSKTNQCLESLQHLI